MESEVFAVTSFFMFVMALLLQILVIIVDSSIDSKCSPFAPCLGFLRATISGHPGQHLRESLIMLQ